MGRTIGPDDVPSKPRKGDRGRGPRSTQNRAVLISKALSRLLRHQAVNEGIPITSDGWVRLDHLQAWKGLTSRNGVNPPPTIEEIWEIVEENEKKRFAVKYAGKLGEDIKAEEAGEVRSQPTATVEELTSGQPLDAQASISRGFSKTVLPSLSQTQAVLDKASSLGISDPQSCSADAETSTAKATEAQSTDSQAQSEAESQAATDTARAISHYRTSNPPPLASSFLIRATQGHSIQSIASDTSLLTPITLDNPETIPQSCVHGTFYGAWNAILATGGLKRMGRNHVHFASGPSLAEIGITDVYDGKEEVKVDGKTGSKVISGMRHDAQILIYIDLKSCLEDVRDQNKDMKWWRSENGVILTEGIERSSKIDAAGEVVSEAAGTATESTPAALEQQQSGPSATTAGEIGQQTAEMKAEGSHKERSLGGRFQKPRKQSKAAQAQAQNDKLVPMKYWSVVVDAKGGRGVIWRQGDGVVKELPESLTSKGNPKDRGRGRVGGQRAAK